jgi:hypothetical protein
MPTWGEIAQIVTAGAAVGALLNSIRNSRKIEVVHKATNSLTDRLVETTKLASHAEGMKDEKANVAAAKVEEQKS